MTRKTKILEILEVLRKECYRDLNAAEASKILLKISSLYGTLIELTIDAEMEYNREFDQMTSTIEKVTEARAKAKSTEKYKEMRVLEGKLEMTKELIRSLKYLLKVKLEEKSEAVY